MQPILTYLMIAALGGTTLVLLLGILNLLKTSKDSVTLSNKLMQWRVIAQVAALILFTLLLMGR